MGNKKTLDLEPVIKALCYLKTETLTESEIRNLIEGKADKSHTHTKSEITDFPEIANNLTTSTSGKVLDATQGKILYDLIAGIEEDMLS